MKIILLILILMAAFPVTLLHATAAHKVETDSLEGITHYGMTIQEIKKTYKQQDTTLEVIYAPMLSDDNMDDYVKRLYDEFLRQIESWLYANTLPVQDMKIVISNCKFCKIGYCKKKKIKEVKFVSYKNDKKDKEIIFKHIDILDKTKYVKLCQSALLLFFEQ